MIATKSDYEYLVNAENHVWWKTDIYIYIYIIIYDYIYYILYIYIYIYIIYNHVYV